MRPPASTFASTASDPRRRAPDGPRGLHGVHLPCRGAARGPRQGGRLEPGVPGGRARPRPVLHPAGRRGPRASNAGVRLVQLQRRDALLLPAPAGAVRGGGRRVRGDGRRGRHHSSKFS